MSAFNTADYSTMPWEELCALVPEEIRTANEAVLSAIEARNPGVAKSAINVSKTGGCRENPILAAYFDRSIKMKGFAGGVIPQDKEKKFEEADANTSDNKEAYDQVRTEAGRPINSHVLDASTGSGSGQKNMIGPKATPEQQARIDAYRAEAVAKWNEEYPEHALAPAKFDEDGNVVVPAETFENVKTGLRDENFATEIKAKMFKLYLEDAKMLCDVYGIPYELTGMNAMGNCVKDANAKFVVAGPGSEPMFTGPTAPLVQQWANEMGFTLVVPNRKHKKIGGSWCRHLVKTTEDIVIGYDYSSSQVVEWVKGTNSDGEITAVRTMDFVITHVGDAHFLKLMEPKKEEVSA
jgi:hypothetical protein